MVANFKNSNNKSHVKKVAILMGDPNKSEAVIPLEEYDPIDSYGTNQLFTALYELKDYSFTILNNHDTLITDLTKFKSKIGYIFNLCDEGFGNDAEKEFHIPALLEILGINYTGSGPQCLGFCYDKSLIRGIAREMGIPVADGILICPGDETFEIPFEFPAFVKPNVGDSSYGITKNNIIHNYSQLENIISVLRKQFGPNLSILVERYLLGSDLSVGLVGNIKSGFTLTAISEEDYSKLPQDLPRICGYEAKWEYNSSYNVIKSIPAQISDKTRDFLLKNSIRLFQRLSCRDYCRIDWRLDSQGNPKLLEVNPNPGLCWDGHLTKMASFRGISFSGLLEIILKTAEERISSEKKEEIGHQQKNINDSKLTKKVNTNKKSIKELLLKDYTN